MTKITTDSIVLWWLWAYCFDKIKQLLKGFVVLILKAYLMIKKCSRIKDFYKKNCNERLNILQQFAELNSSSVELLTSSIKNNAFVEKMSENVVSAFSLPYSIATNFLINGKDYLIPMVTEEPSVVAGASNAAKKCRSTGGFNSIADQSMMIGQVHIINISDIQKKQALIQTHKLELLEIANKKDAALVAIGGGAIDIKFKQINEDILIIYLVVDVKDAMGANAVNTMVEAIAPDLERLTGGKALIRIVSNLAIYRIARASAVWSEQELGSELIEKIILASEIAKIDIFRAVTHNKGIMNGIDAVAIATGNDFRALEAGAHGFASYEGLYKPLSNYEKDENGNLVGKIELPIAVGVIGGATKINHLAQLSLEILGVNKASDLAEIMASVGLAQNFAAINAIVSNGIQHGHMKLHCKNIAVNAGIPEDLIDLVAEKMIAKNTISFDSAREILDLIKSGKI
ncbi:MAG: Hydroxymethylglutaryl-CoA reductase, degradative [candidate division TM6 bacterium GW2011_GWF2_37_49]|nr:MAG: Hydroxymethylglutaryl-CoA reductase, degradative [candidate division TM6 bacterium GW2011_GWF2_37_49]